MKLYRGGRFAITHGDITRLHVDAIVNPTNPTLAHGMGVDGAIHHAAGPELDRACAALGGAAFGEAVITPGFLLPARFVVHVVGPVWRDGTYGEEDELDAIYDTALEVAKKHGIRAIGFPAISTGLYGFPLERATAVALSACRVYCDNYPEAYDRITFCPHTEADEAVYLRLAERFFTA